MIINKWDPFHEFWMMPMSRTRLLGPLFDSAHDTEMDQWTIPMDVIQEPDKFVIRATIPGVKAEDLDITIDENMLSIKAETKTEEGHEHDDYMMRERHHGVVQRTLRLPHPVDADHAKSSYDLGVLTITLPKAESKSVKRITVGASPMLDGKKG